MPNKSDSRLFSLLLAIMVVFAVTLRGGKEPDAQPTTASSVRLSAVGRAVVTASSQAAARTAIGVTSYTSPLTTNGDLFVRAAGVDARLGVAAFNGYTLGVVSGSPAYALPSALVTASGDAAAMRTALGVTGSSLALPSTTTDAILWLDTSTLQTSAAGAPVRRWRALIGPDAEQYLANTPPTIGASGGISEVVFNGAASLTVDTAPAIGSGARTMVVVTRNAVVISGQAYNHVFHCGSSGSGQTYGILTRVNSSYVWGNHYYFTTLSSAVAPTTARTMVAAVFGGTNDNFYLNGSSTPIATGTPTISTTATLCSIGCAAHSVAEFYQGSLVFVAAWSRALSTSELSSLYTWLQGRGLV